MIKENKWTLDFPDAESASLETPHKLSQVTCNFIYPCCISSWAENLVPENVFTILIRLLFWKVQGKSYSTYLRRKKTNMTSS
jgi:hypothetical protein